MHTIEITHYTISETAELLRRSVRTIYRMIADGTIETEVIYGKKLIPREQIDASLRSEPEPKGRTRRKKEYDVWV